MMSQFISSEKKNSLVTVILDVTFYRVKLKLYSERSAISHFQQ